MQAMLLEVLMADGAWDGAVVAVHTPTSTPTPSEDAMNAIAKCQMVNN